MTSLPRKDWPVSAKTERELLSSLLDCAIGQNKEGERARSPRDRIMAARTIAMLKQLSLKQTALQLRRERLYGRVSEVSLADLVGEAEGRAEQRRNEREQASRPKRGARTARRHV